MTVNSKRRALLLATAASAAAGTQTAFHAHAQAWPSRPIRVVVPFPAGGPLDVLARAIGQRLTDALSQPVLVENRPGANTIIGADTVAKSAPDGYSLFFTSDTPISINPLLYSKLPYKAEDFTPVALVVHIVEYLMVSADVPVNSLQEFVTYSKANPGKLNYGSFGLGSNGHLEAEAFKQATGADLTHVPFKGQTEVIPAMLNGQIQAVFTSPQTALPHIRSGKIKALAVESKERSALFPDVPTFAESGVTGFEARAWFGFLAPAKTPSEIVQRLSTEIGRIVATPEFREKYIASVGFEPAAGGVEAFNAALAADKVKYANFMKAANVKLD